MEKTVETKAERFIRVAEPRVGRACKAISLIGNFATGDYEYTEQQDVRRDAGGAGHRESEVPQGERA